MLPSPSLTFRGPARLFDKVTAFWLSLCFLLLLFSPKINLISLGARESAGVRIDDLLLLGFSLIFFWAHFALKLQMTVFERRVGACVAFSLFSFLMNRLFVMEGWLHVHASIFYCLRMMEYFLFFYVGMLSARFFRLSNVIKAFFLWNLLLMTLQKLGLLGQFTVYGYASVTLDRVSGIASFPSEAGMLLNMMFCFLLYDEDTRSWSLRSLLPPLLRAFFLRTYPYWLFLVCCTFVIFTGSRIALVGLVVPFLACIRQDLKWRSPMTLLLVGAAVLAAFSLAMTMIQHTEAIFTRSAGLLSWRNVDLIGMVWEQIDLSYDPIGNEVVRYEDYDLSWWMRIHKWCYALKIYYLHPESYLQGVGPGFAMSALDGGYVRLLTENGIIGFFLFFYALTPIYRQSKQLQWVVVAFLINMIFFDVYLAYKPMSLLFLMSGATFFSFADKKPL